ncbi:MAG: type II toxin-antitoxin system VapC family toxin [Spirochaetes bacterium]|nr:type II toxin-antitoxin system VapC family toxin [Spirochaetota bacterium]
MKYLLDTNIVSYWMRGDANVIQRLSGKSPDDLAVSAVTYAEINYGIEKSPNRKTDRRNRIKSIAAQIEMVPFDRDAAGHYAAIRVYLEKKGVPISERDLQIASIARSRRLCLVTHNVKEFSRVPDLIIEDWYLG